MTSSKHARNGGPPKGLKSRNILINAVSVCQNGRDNNWTATWQNQQSGYAPSEDSDQPWHPPSLIRVFAVRMKKGWFLSYPLSAQRRLWSDWADAQADLGLRWARMPFCWFCHEAAQLCLNNFNISNTLTPTLPCKPLTLLHLCHLDKSICKLGGLDVFFFYFCFIWKLNSYEQIV